MNKKLILPGVAVVALAGTLFLSGYAVHAQDATSGVPSIVQEIASKFNLNVSDVQAVFDSHRQTMLSKMETAYEDRLSADVTAGKITAAQKDLILAKHKELMANKPSSADWKNLTADERKAKFQQQKTDLQNWANQNGIDLRYLIGGFGMRGHMGKWLK